ncbi:MAG: response regulator [Burkholderiaceae bacterium]
MTACTVETLGFNVSEQKTLAATFALSVRRELVYARWDSSSSQPANLLLVDGDNPQAVQEMLSRKLGGLPAVVVVASLPSQYKCTSVEKPIRFLRLFKALDQALEAKLDADADAELSSRDSHHSTWTSTLAIPLPAPTEALLQPFIDLPHRNVPAMLNAEQPPGVQRHSAALSSVPVKPPEELTSLSAVGGTDFRKVVSLVSSAERPANMNATDSVRTSNPAAEWVLVVDDNLAVRRFMAQKLQQFSINVDYAASGEQAIGLTGSKRYTCVFLDVVMPGLDGYQVCKLIKANRENNATRVVMLTSRDGTFDKIRGKMAGCDAYLTKPIDEEKLMNAIIRFLPEGAGYVDLLEPGNSSMFLDSQSKKNHVLKLSRQH